MSFINQFSRICFQNCIVKDHFLSSGTAEFRKKVTFKGPICTSDLSVDGGVTVSGDLSVEGNIYQSNGTFDIIICGVGTAGAIAFRRIADGNPTLSILGLVTGGYLNDDPVSKYPYGASDPDFGSINLFQSLTGTPRHTDSIVNHNWLNNSFNKNTINILAGRGLGGAGMHNFLFAVRPSPGYHDYTSTFAGPYSAQWNDAACNSIYKTMETFVGPADPNRGTTGPVTILQSAVPANSTYGDTFGDILASMASESLDATDNGLSVTTDFNNNIELALNKSDQSFLYVDGAAPGGVSRSSSAAGYLGTDFLTPQGFSVDGSKRRILYNTYVKRVIFDENDNAVAVEAIVNGACALFKANKKIIISAGGMRSPGILERSGIGSGALFSDINVCQVVENPNIGENFMTHSAPAFLFTLDSNATTNGSFPAMMKTISSTPYPYDRAVQFNTHYADGQSLFLQVFNSYGANYQQYQELGIPLDGTNVYAGFAMLLQPTSRGSVHIFDTGTDAIPKWVYNMNSVEDLYAGRAALQHIKRVEADLTSNHPTMGFSLKFPSSTQYAGYPGAPTIAFTASITATVMTVTAISSGTIEITMSVLEGAAFSTAPASAIIQGTQVLSQIFPLIGGESIGGIGRYNINNSQTVVSMSMHGDYLDQAAASINIVQAHPCGTCKMGDRTTQQGVVDGQLHVYGVQKLMVADNSIWPQIPNSNTTFAAMLVGYRAADICLATI